MDTHKPTLFTGPLLIVIAALLWGLDGILRRQLGGIPPITIVFLEHLIGLCILLPFVWKSFKKEKLTKPEWFSLGLVALLSGLLGTLWFTKALLATSFISFSVVFLLQKLQPIFAITSARLLLKEKVDRRYIIWAGISLVAAFFVTFPNGVVNFKTGAGTITAALFAVGAAAAWGSSTAFSKKVLSKHTSGFTTGMRFAMTAVFALVGVMLLGKTATLAAPTPVNYLTLLVIALSTGMVSLAIYYRGLKSTPVVVSTILELFYPLIAVIIDIFLYDSVLAWSQYLAAAVLLYAMYRVGKLTRPIAIQSNEI